MNIPLDRVLKNLRVEEKNVFKKNGSHILCPHCNEEHFLSPSKDIPESLDVSTGQYIKVTEINQELKKESYPIIVYHDIIKKTLPAYNGQLSTPLRHNISQTSLTPPPSPASQRILTTPHPQTFLTPPPSPASQRILTTPQTHLRGTEYPIINYGSLTPTIKKYLDDSRSQLLKGSYPQVAFLDDCSRVVLSLGFLFDENSFKGKNTATLHTPHHKVSINFEPRDPTEQTGSASQYKILPSPNYRGNKNHLVGSHDVRRAFGGGNDRFNISPVSVFTNSASGKIGKYEAEARDYMRKVYSTQMNEVSGQPNDINPFVIDVIATKNIFIQVTETTYDPDVMRYYLFENKDYQEIMIWAEKNNVPFSKFIKNLTSYIPKTQNRFLWHFERDHMQSLNWDGKVICECLLVPNDIMEGAGSIEVPRFSRTKGKNLFYDDKYCQNLCNIWNKKERHDGTYYFFETNIEPKYFIDNIKLFDDISRYISNIETKLGLPDPTLVDRNFEGFVSRVQNLRNKYSAKHFAVKRLENWIKPENIIISRTRSGINTNLSIEYNEDLDQ